MMKRDFHATQEQREAQLAGRADELRAALRILPPELIASRSGATYLELGQGRGEFHLPFWGPVHVITFPELIAHNPKGDIVSAFQQALFFYYLATADGTLPTGTWSSFADLPDGRMYVRAFQGYTGDAASRHFGNSLDEFRRACAECGGTEVEIGNVSYFFQALPRVSLMVTYWLGDDEFPPSCKILFDSSASHYLPIDACALLGSALISRIMKASKP